MLLRIYNNITSEIAKMEFEESKMYACLITTCSSTINSKYNEDGENDGNIASNSKNSAINKISKQELW